MPRARKRGSGKIGILALDPQVFVPTKLINVPFIDFIRLFTLAALWGASFLFMRIVTPDLGPMITTEARVALAGLVLLLWLRASGSGLDWRAHWKPLLIVGAFNSALPFTLLAYAALSLPVGYLAILNATTPMFGALIGLIWLRESMTLRKLGGVGLGILGVGLVVRLGPVTATPAVLLACAASIGAAFSYGCAATYLKCLRKPVPTVQMAAGTQIAAALLMLPLIPFSPLRAMPDALGLFSIVALALGCTAVAYLLYFRLVKNIGPTKSLTVTFLVPVFALLWGALFLGEAVTLRMMAGCVVVLGATWLVVTSPNRD